MDVATGITAASNAITLLKGIKDAEKAYDAATLRTELANVISELANVKISLVEHGQKIRELEDENKRLLASDSEIEALSEQAGYLYRTEGNGLVGWPACPACIEREKRAVFLIQNGHYLNAKCPRCTSKFAPVTSYLSPGFSRADKNRKDREEETRKINQTFRGFY